MTREVELTISGLQWGEDMDQDNIETVVPGEYFKKNDSHYILFEETTEGFQQTSKNRIKCKNNLLELTRQGLVNTHMVFEAGKVHMTDYVTPYGHFLLGVRTENLQMEETEESICITAEYKIEIGEEPISTNKIHIIIRPRP